MNISKNAAQALWLCLVETQQAIALHLNDIDDQAYIAKLATQHATNNSVLTKIKRS